jgi:hypothetical protein
MKKNTIGHEFKFGDIETTNKIYDNIEDKSIGGIKGMKNFLLVLKIPGHYFNKPFFPICFLENSAAELKAIFNDLRQKRNEKFSGRLSESF